MCSRAADDELWLSHDRIRDALYQHLLPPRRALLHRRVAETLDARQGTGDAADPITVGMHYKRAGVWDRAASHLHEAARLAVERFAYRDAVAASEAALEAVRHLPAERAGQARAFELQMLLAFSLVFLSEYARALEHYDAAAHVAEMLADEECLVRVLAARVTAFAFLGRHAEARETGERALALAMRRGDLTGQAWAHVGLARVCFHTGDYPGCARHARAMAGCLRSVPGGPTTMVPLLPPLLGDQYWLGVSHAMLGEFPEGFAVARAMLDAAERLDRPLARIWAAYALAAVHLFQGNAGEARAILEPLLAQCRDVEFWAFFARIAWALGVAHALDGRVADAVPLLEQAVAHTTSTRFRSGFSVLLADLAEGVPAGGSARRRAADGPGGARHWLASWESAGTRPWRVARWGRRRRIATRPTWPARKRTSARPSCWPRSCRCGRPRRAVTSASAPSTTGPAHLVRARAELALAAEAFRALGMASWLTLAEAELEEIRAASAGTSLPTGVVESLGADAHAHAGSREDAGGASEDRSDQHGVPSR